MRSTTCKGSNNQFLEEYHSLVAATIAAEELKVTYGTSLTPSQCRTCGYWHLSAGATRPTCRLCTDSGLFFKDLYPTKPEAQKTADWIKRERKIQLYPYKCPHTSGWHLTKTPPGKKK